MKRDGEREREREREGENSGENNWQVINFIGIKMKRNEREKVVT